jgi:hypothetical protein
MVIGLATLNNECDSNHSTLSTEGGLYINRPARNLSCEVLPMKLANLLSFVSSPEKNENPEQGLVLSRRLKELLENTEQTAVDSASAADAQQKLSLR